MIFDLETVELPKKLNPAPIVEAIVEIRFESDLSPENVIDKLLIKFGEEYPKINDLPIVQFPAQMRDKDPQLRVLPVKQLIKDGKIIQIGGRVISFVNKQNYLGWGELKKSIKGMIEKLKKVGVATQYKRLGIRYLNTFNFNILDEINISFLNMGNQIIDEKIDFRLSLEQEPFQATINLSNNIRKIVENKVSKGSLIDIDAFTENFHEDYLLDLIEGAHSFEKKLFFALVKKETINKYYNPDWSR